MLNVSIIDHIATIATSPAGDSSIELNLISYNGAAPKLDLRRWDLINNKMLKGIALTRKEACTLNDSLTDYLATNKGGNNHDQLR